MIILLEVFVKIYFLEGGSLNFILRCFILLFGSKPILLLLKSRVNLFFTALMKKSSDVIRSSENFYYRSLKLVNLRRILNH